MDIFASRPHVPTHLLPDALVADETGGDEPVAFVLPDDLTAETVTDETLATLEADAIAAFDRESATPTPTAATLATSTALQAAITEVRNEAARRIGEATENAEALAAMRDQVHADPEDPADPEAAADPEEGDPAGDPAPAVDPAPAADPEPVLASGAAPRRIPLSRIRDRAQAPVIPDPAGAPVNITAASGIRGYDAGQRLQGADDIGRAMHAAAAGMNDGQRALVASIEVPTTLTVEESATKTQMAEAVAELTSRDRIEEALVAAGGWCAPNDRMWETFGVESATAGILDTPTMGIERGGLDFPVSPSLANVFAVEGIAWEWTEADDIAALGNPHEDPADDVAKPCFRIPCPTWDSAKLTALGLCITHGNLSNRAYPENTARWVELAMAAHAHRLNAIRIARMATGSTAVTLANAHGGAVAPVLNAVDLQANDTRDKFRMDPNAVVEAVFPMWTTGVLRADVARRTGVDMVDVSTTDVLRWFADRQVAAQFVYDWQSLQLGGAGTDGFREVWPTSLQFMMYAAGTWVRGTGGRIDLAVGQDSGAFRGMDQVKVNDYTVAWSEEFDLTAKVGHESRLVTIPIVANGVTSAAATAPTGSFV